MLIIIIIIFVLIFISGISLFLYKKNQDDKEIDLENKLKVEQENKLKAEQENKLKAEQENKLKAEQEKKLKAEQENKLKAEQENKLKAEQENKLKAEQENKLKAEDINYIIKNNDDKFYTDNTNFLINQNKFLIQSIKPLPSLEDIDKYDKVFEQIEKSILLNNQNMLNDDKNKIKFINQEIIFI